MERHTPIIALDIETQCNVPGCEGGCKHALDCFKNHVSLIGCVHRGVDGTLHRAVFRDVHGLVDWLGATFADCYELVGQNLKWDLKTLAAHGTPELYKAWRHDTRLMAQTLLEKIPQDWLIWYEAERQRRNENLPRGISHRKSSPHSLKTLAPYFLGIQPFWENPENHDNEEYCLKDAEYTLRLFELFEQKLKAEGSWEFYTERLMPWTRDVLLPAETAGISLDMELLGQMEKEAAEKAASLKERLEATWAEAFAEYKTSKVRDIVDTYLKMTDEALARLKAPTASQREKTRSRYDALMAKAIEKLPPLNLDSPAQLTWLLRDRLKLDITGWDGDETTGKPVLKKLAAEREDIRLFLEYRGQQKLATAFFPSYREMQVGGKIYTTFNAGGARTGRLSSSEPNLQQVPGSLHRLFRARPGYKLATYDMSAIEPRLIAYYTHDVNLCRIVMSGEDFHGHTTSVLFEKGWAPHEIKEKYPTERKCGKEGGLAYFYGAGTGMAQQSARKYGFEWSLGDCKRKLSAFRDYYSGVFNFRDNVLNPVLLEGRAVSNLLGRQFRIDDPTNVHMQGLNTLIQGSASDLVQHSAWRINKEFQEKGIDGRVLLLVHDEIVTEIPEERAEECQAIIVDAMTSYRLETPHGLIPLLVEGKIADRWEK